VNEQDRTHAVNAFITDARTYANNAPFVQETKKATEEKIRDLLKAYVDEVAFIYAEKLPLTPAQ
jgi:hypothetical protein